MNLDRLFLAPWDLCGVELISVDAGTATVLAAKIKQLR